MTDKITMRKCQGCQKVMERSLMIKITKNHLTGKLVVNPDSKITGRSLYVCKNEQCIKTLLKKKRIERNFKTGMTHELNLLESVKGLEDKPRQ